ncbi:MAG: Endo,4-beta-xylanase precursor [Myxococcaceae bacterium]|nr:Endo,4-beta-xylanase precursor [Myxococcaceae bacterium]
MRLRRGSVFTCALVVVAAACKSGSNAPAGTSSATEPPPGSSGWDGAWNPLRPPTGSASGSSSGSTSSGGPDASPPAPTAVPYVHFDVNHILSTGQSNSVANGGTPPLDVMQPYNNLMFSAGVIPASGCDSRGCTTYAPQTSFVPLVEGDTFFYPVETMSAPMANTVTALARGPYAATVKDADHVVLVSLHGRSGNTYWSLRKGGSSYLQNIGYVLPFDDGMREVADGFALATAAGKSYVVRAVTAIHGESDHYAYSNNRAEVPLPGTDGKSTITNYLDGLLEWQRDYQDSVQAITGQTQPVPLLISQMHLWTNVPHSQVVEWQYEAHVKSKGKVVLATPAYFLGYATDCLHYTSDSQRWIGEYFAKAYARIVFDGLPWEPVRPQSVTIAANVVTAKFYVPKPPLVLDTTRVTNPGSYGFEFVDAAGANVAITDVQVTSADTVTIKLATPAPGGRLRYAFTAPIPNCPGPTTGVRGNLRDSDTTPSLYGHELFNWGVTFEEPAL